jgi:hypothetical protein
MIKPCGGCLLTFGISVTDSFSINPATQFRWQLRDDSGIVVNEGIVFGNQFVGGNWLLPTNSCRRSTAH